MEDEDLGGTLQRLKALEGAADGFGSALTRGLKAAAVEGRSLDGVLQRVLTRLSDRALDAALKPLGDLLQSLAGGLAGAIGRGIGGIVGGVVPFADGGVVAAPSYFPMPDGRTGLAGEAGAEAILPLSRGADGTLGVRAEAGAVSVTFNVTTPDVEGFRRSEAQVSAMLARAVGRGRRGL